MKAIEVKGDLKAVAVLERAGSKARDQTQSFNEASHVHAIEQGAWENDSGDLTKSLNKTRVDKDSIEFYSDVPYARFVFYGTVNQSARPPKIDEFRLRQAVVERIANDIVGEQ